MINGVLKPGYTTNNWFRTLCILARLSLFVAFLSFSSLFLFLHCSLPSILSPLSLCSTVFILLQPPCFCGAVSVVDTMKTGRIHYLALHSPILSGSPPYLPPFFTLTFNNECIFSSHCCCFSSPCLSLSLFVLLQLFLPWLVFTLFSVSQWLIIPVCLSVHSATYWYHPLVS